MKKSVITIITSCCIIGTFVLGCGNLTTSKVEENQKNDITFGTVLEEIGEMEVQSGSFVIEATNSYKVLEQQTLRNRRMYADVVYKWSQDPMDFYLKEDYEIIQFEAEENFNLNTQSWGKTEKPVDMHIEMYVVHQGEEAVAYVNQGNNIWGCADAEITDEQMIYMEDFLFERDLLTEEQYNIPFENSNIKINEKDTYQLVVKGTYEQAGILLKEMMDKVLDKIDGISMNVEWEFTFFVDRESYMPLSCKIQLKELVDFSEKEKTVWSELCKIHITYENLNEIEDIVVPNSIKSYAIDMRKNK